MLSTTDYQYITDKIADAQQQSYNSLEALSSILLSLSYLTSTAVNSIPENFTLHTQNAYSYIVTYDILDSRLMHDMTKALQNHILVHWD